MSIKCRCVPSIKCRCVSIKCHYVSIKCRCVSIKCRCVSIKCHYVSIKCRCVPSIKCRCVSQKCRKVAYLQEVVTNVGDMRQPLQHHIHIIVRFDIIESGDTREVQDTSERARPCVVCVECRYVLRCEFRIQLVLDVCQRCVLYLIIVRQTEETVCQKIQEHVVLQVDRVGEGVGLYAATLKWQATQ